MKFNLKARSKAHRLEEEFTSLLELEHGQKGRALRDAAHRLRMQGIKIGPAGLRRLFAEYKNYGPDVLLDRRMVEFPLEYRLPKDFVRYLKQQREDSSKTFASVWRKLITDWKEGKPLAGYDELPKAEVGKDYPRGWSQQHLCRVSRLSAFERAAKKLKVRVDTSSKFTTLLTSLDKLKSEILDLRAEVLKRKPINE